MKAGEELEPAIGTEAELSSAGMAVWRRDAVEADKRVGMMGDCEGEEGCGSVTMPEHSRRVPNSTGVEELPRDYS
jgi:hypothetical protein